MVDGQSVKQEAPWPVVQTAGPVVQCFGSTTGQVDMKVGVKINGLQWIPAILNVDPWIPFRPSPSFDQIVYEKIPKINIYIAMKCFI